MLIQENLIIVVERNIEQKDRKVKASEFLVANHNHRITELQFIAFCNIRLNRMNFGVIIALMWPWLIDSGNDG